MVVHSILGQLIPMLLADPFKPKHLISPNMHVILVHFPLGMFVFGLFLEVFSFLWRRSSVRVAARWMILLGGLFAVPAALSGIDAYADVRENTTHVVKTDEGTMKLPGLSDQQWHYLQKHILLAGIGAALAALGVTVALGLSDHWRRKLHIPLLIVLIAAATLLTFGSHFGGEGIYLEGTAVQLRGKVAQGFEYFAPARSVHVMLAGLGIAVSLGALGMSFRAVSAAKEFHDEAVTRTELDALVNPAPNPMPRPRRVTDDISVARTLNEEAELTPRRVPSTRFWALTALLFLLTLFFGVWYLETNELSRSVSELTASGVSNDVWTLARTPGLKNRQGDHIVIGVLLILFPLVLAGVVRWGPRRHVLVSILCLVMVLIVAVELWLGLLLIYRGTKGPVYRYIDTESETAMVVPARCPAGPLLRL